MRLGSNIAILFYYIQVRIGDERREHPSDRTLVGESAVPEHPGRPCQVKARLEWAEAGAENVIEHTEAGVGTVTDGLRGADLEAGTGILETSMMIEEEMIQEREEGIEVGAERGESMHASLALPRKCLRFLSMCTGETMIGKGTAAGADLEIGRG